MDPRKCGSTTYVATNHMSCRIPSTYVILSIRIYHWNTCVSLQDPIQLWHGWAGWVWGVMSSRNDSGQMAMAFLTRHIAVLHHLASVASFEALKDQTKDRNQDRWLAEIKMLLILFAFWKIRTRQTASC